MAAAHLSKSLDILADACDVRVDKVKESLKALTIPGFPTTLLELDEQVGFEISGLISECARG